MEQYGKLPQIRMSILQKLVSTKTQANCLQQKRSSICKNQELQVSKPYFYKDRLVHNFCNHLKCNCKAKRGTNDNLTLDQSKQNKERSLRKLQSFKNTYRNKTEGEENYDKNKYVKNNGCFENYVESQMKKSQINRYLRAAKELYKQIQKELKSKVYIKHGISCDDRQVKSRVEHYLLSEFAQDWSNQEKLICQLSQSRSLGVSESSMEIKNKKINRKQLIKKIDQFLKSQRPLSPEKHQKSQTYLKSEHSYGFRKASVPRMKKNGQKKKKLKTNPINICELLHQKQTQNEKITQLISELMCLDEQAFSEKLIEMEDIINACQGQEKNNAQKTLKKIVEKFTTIVEETNNKKAHQKHQRQEMLKKLKLLMPSEKENHSEQLATKEQMKTNSLIMNQFFSKKQVGVKKSQKTVRYVESELEEQLNQQENKKFLTNVSLAQDLEQESKKFINDNEFQQKRLSIMDTSQAPKNTYHSRAKSTLNIKASKNQQNLLYLFKSDQICESPKIQSQKTNLTKQNKAKNTAHNLDESEQPQRMKKAKYQNYNDSIQPARQPINKQYIRSKFKIEKDEQLKILKQRTRYRQSDLKCYFQQKKQIKQRGRARLQEEDHPSLIIQESDSLFTKKKKIRKIKELVEHIQERLKRQNINITQSELINQLLVYINLYEIECELILRNGVRTEMKKAQTEINEKIKFNFFDKNDLTQDLKFVYFNTDQECYDEEEQISYSMTIHKEFQLSTLDTVKKSEIVVAHPHNRNEKKRRGLFLKQQQLNHALLQKQMPQLGHEELINAVSTAPLLSRRGTKIFHQRSRNQIKSNIEPESLKFRKNQMANTGKYSNSKLKKLNPYREFKDGNQMQTSCFSKKSCKFLLTQNPLNESTFQNHK